MKSILWRHKFLIVIWLVVFGIAGYTANLLFFKTNGTENPLTKTTSADAAQQSIEQSREAVKNQPKQTKKGLPAQDGDLEITATGTTCKGETSIGTPYAMAEAEGAFCRLTITLKNVGQKAVTLPLSAQKAFLSKDESSPVHIDATQYAQTDQTKGYWYEQIPPGATVSGDLIFGVNGSDTLIQAELHGAEGSPGVTISL